MFKFFREYFDFSERLIKLAEVVNEECQEKFREIEKISAYNNARVLSAFIKNKVSTQHLTGTTGYGYNDSGREKIDAVFAEIFGTEDALVRHNFVSGTHAIRTGLAAVGGSVVCVTGEPYDTLQHVIKDENLSFFCFDFNKEKEIIAEKILKNPVVYIQRSKGYEFRNALSAAEVNDIVKFVKNVNPLAVVIVDNCYGEFVEKENITADLIIGSLIKNPGGGIARTGGYICGRKDLIEKCAKKLSISRDLGCTLGMNRDILMGLYNAPNVVMNALKIGTFAACLFKKSGYETTDVKGDIVVAVKIGSQEKLEKFCRGIQSASPVDSSFAPIPGDMPGYDCEIIMAAGAFTNGSSIELSADAPIREPYIVYLQGGTNYINGVIGILNAVKTMNK